MQDTALKAILACGTRYRQEMLLPNWIPDELTADWRRAFDFFLGRACYQGRSDNVSEKVEKATREVLAAQLYESPEWSDSRFTGFRPLLETRVGAGLGKPGKARDVEMVVSALRFISVLANHNLVSYSLARIGAGQLQAHYEELQAAASSSGIVQVGPKIAAFYLRDLVTLFDLDRAVPPEELFCLQPIDVWVRRLVERLELAPKGASDEVVRTALLSFAAQHDCSTLLLNQGLWYLGKNAFDVLLDYLLAETETAAAGNPAS